ncbi:hypothetical protein [Rhodococcoides yunnanense]|uniref:hypothetical protein n=1 Tax=Rhodococcoides yunnanense TaxID=278209 RepID=UPI001114B85B|nr:hypothetical protein [Rhodococcus yunnanensis]
MNPETGRYEANGCYWDGETWKSIVVPPETTKQSTRPSAKQLRSMPGMNVTPPPGSHEINPETGRYEASDCYWDGQNWKQIVNLEIATGVTSLATKPRLIAAAVAVAACVLAIGIVIGVVFTPNTPEPAQSLPSTTRHSTPVTTASLSPAELEAASASAAAAAASQTQATAAARARAAEVALDQNRRAMEAQQAAADAQAAKFDRSTYAILNERDYGLLARNPSASKGQKIVVYGYVTQFDSITGSSTFRADTAATPGSNWYDFDLNTIVNFDPKIGANVIAKDIVALYVEVSGTTTYKTTLGANETAPVLTANVIDVVG